MVTLEGEITQVMESWPLQLVVETAEAQYDVALELDTRISKNGEPAAPSDLSPGLKVRISGPTTNQNYGLIAKTIEIL
jgi:hypothetical protein